MGIELPTGVKLLLIPKIFYFFYFAAMASLIPFLTLYYEQVGLSGRQIGLLAGIAPLVMLLSAPLWGALADTTRQHKRLLVIAIGGVFVTAFLMSQTTAYPWLVVVVVLYAFCGAPVVPLVDNTVIELLGERKDEYGKQRLWGAVGWGIAAPIVGWVIERNGLQWAFYCYFVLLIGVLASVVRLPVGRSSIGGPFGKNVRLMLSNRRWLLFLATIFIGGMGLTFALNFLFLYMSDMGASETLMGLSLTVATISELPLWFFADRLLDRWGSRGVLIFSLMACALQAFGYSLVRAPWLVLPVQLLHGPAFSAMWAAGVSYAAEIAPEGTRATAQTLFSSVAMGLRSAVGALIGGMLYEGFGAVLMFQVGGASTLFGLLVFVLAGRERKGDKNEC